mmetsp:Transcript_31649/g.97839  ORF Transcript_31649/g.97839 Transcript_31649/m.97839 type:complete len:228 (-) Transcript_31649:139-822(-)
MRGGGAACAGGVESLVAVNEAHAPRSGCCRGSARTVAARDGSGGRGDARCLLAEVGGDLSQLGTDDAQRAEDVVLDVGVVKDAAPARHDVRAQRRLVEHQLEHLREAVVAERLVDDAAERVGAELLEAEEAQVVEHRDGRAVLLVLLARRAVAGDGGVEERAVAQDARGGLADEGGLLLGHLAVREERLEEVADVLVLGDARGVGHRLERDNALLGERPHVHKLHRR